MTLDEVVGSWMVLVAVPLAMLLVFGALVIDGQRRKRKRPGCPGCKRNSRKRGAYCVDCLQEAKDKFWTNWERTETR